MPHLRHQYEEFVSHPRPQKADKNRKPWQRMALSSFGIGIVAAMWRWGVYHLYSLPEHSIAAYASMTNNAAYVIGAIVIFMVTGRLIYEWKNDTAAAVNLAQGIMSQRAESVSTENVNITTEELNADSDMPRDRVA